MARTKSISTIETELRKAEADLKKAQEKVDTLSERVLELQKQKQNTKPGRLLMPIKGVAKHLMSSLLFLMSDGCFYSLQAFSAKKMKN